MEPSNPIRAMTNALAIGTYFSRLSSSSRAASSTIMISPMMPSTSRSGKKSRSCNPAACNPICKAMPSAISMMTAGIFVFREISLNRKDRITMTDTSMMTLYEVRISVMQAYFFEILQE